MNKLLAVLISVTWIPGLLHDANQFLSESGLQPFGALKGSLIPVAKIVILLFVFEPLVNEPCEFCNLQHSVPSKVGLEARPIEHSRCPMQFATLR